MKTTLLPFIFLTLGIHFASAQAKYGPWTPSECYKGIEFAIKQEPINPQTQLYPIEIKIRTLFDETAFVSYKVTKAGEKRPKELGKRLKIQPKKEYTLYDKLPYHSITIHTGKLRFKEDKGEYIPCDK